MHFVNVAHPTVNCVAFTLMFNGKLAETTHLALLTKNACRPDCHIRSFIPNYNYTAWVGSSMAHRTKQRVEGTSHNRNTFKSQ